MGTWDVDEDVGYGMRTSDGGHGVKIWDGTGSVAPGWGHQMAVGSLPNIWGHSGRGVMVVTLYGALVSPPSPHHGPTSLFGDPMEGDMEKGHLGHIWGHGGCGVMVVTLYRALVSP